jgi:bacillithiol disulfide reductase
MIVHDVIIVGAGPAGLATAIAATKRNLSYLVVEKGALVNTILHFPMHMVFFTTPELLEIGGLPFVTPYEKPTRKEALRYYRRTAETYNLKIAFGETVVAVRPDSYESGSPHPSPFPASGERGLRLADAPAFLVESRRPDGAVEGRRARTVVIATGAYDLSNLCDIPGENLPHVSHYYTEPHPYWRKPVVIVGGQNSAAEAALDLHRAGAHVTIVHRGPEFGRSLKYWVKPDLENRVKEGSIAARLNARVVRITEKTAIVQQTVGSYTITEELPADGVFLLTGYHSDVRLLAACGVRCDPVTFEPEFNSETFESNVPGLYLAGQVITGRQSGKIFIENGRFHGERVVDVIARRLAPSEADALVSR